MSLSNYAIAKTLEPEQNVIIRTHAQHAGGGSQEFYGRFQSLTPKGGNYELKIKRNTGATDLANRPVYEDLNFTNHNIAKIIPC